VETKPSLLLVVQAPKERVKLLGRVEEQLMASDRFRLVPLPGLVPLMQQEDAKAGLRTKGAELMEEGRKAMVALDKETALARLNEARGLYRKGFVRYYDPRVLAQVHLLLGVLALEHQARPDLARQELVEVHHLDPGFTLDAHYSPAVRAAFQDAARGLPPRPAPPPEDLERLTRLAGARAGLVLTIQDTGEQSLVQGSLFLQEKGAYTKVESRLLDTSDPGRQKRQAGALGALLLAALEAHYPAPKKPEQKKPKKKIVKPPPPPPTPWYLRWYTWTAVGVVAATAAIVLPLTLRTETSDVIVKW
jgi:hypothetical protein